MRAEETRDGRGGVVSGRVALAGARARRGGRGRGVRTARSVLVWGLTVCRDARVRRALVRVWLIGSQYTTERTIHNTQRARRAPPRWRNLINLTLRDEKRRSRRFTTSECSLG